MNNSYSFFDPECFSGLELDAGWLLRMLFGDGTDRPPEPLPPKDDYLIGKQLDTPFSPSQHSNFSQFPE